MKIAHVCLLLVISLETVAFAVSFDDEGTQQRVEQEGNVARKPRVLILGDSTSMRYIHPLRKILGEEFDLVRPNGNHEGTTKARTELKKWLADGDWDVIHFNFGLHDFKHVDPETGKSSPNPDHPYQATPEKYEENLQWIVQQLQATGAKLIFATSTPVPTDDRRRVIDGTKATKYNEIAKRVMAKHDIPINDLYEFALPRLKELQIPRDVHFHAKGSKALAEQIAKKIRELAAQQ